MANCLTAFNNFVHRIINSLPDVKLCGKFNTIKACVIITFCSVVIGIADLFIQLVRYLIQSEIRANPLGYNFSNAFVFVLVFVCTLLWVVFSLAVFFAVYLSNKPKKDTISDLSIRQYFLCYVFYVFVCFLEIIFTIVDFANFGSGTSFFFGLIWICFKLGLSVYSALVVTTCFRELRKLEEELKPDEKVEDGQNVSPNQDVSVSIPLKEDLSEENDDDNTELAKKIIQDLIRKIIHSAQDEENSDGENEKNTVQNPQVTAEENIDKPQGIQIDQKPPDEIPPVPPTKKESTRNKDCTLS